MAVEVDPIDGIDAAGNETPQSALDELLGPDRTDEDTAWRLYHCQWCALQAHDCDKDSSHGWDVSIAADADARTAIAKTARQIFSGVDVEEACFVFPLDLVGECLYEATSLSWGALSMEEYRDLPNPYMSEEQFRKAAMGVDYSGGRQRVEIKGGWGGSPELGFKLNTVIRKIKLSFGAVTESGFYHLRKLMRGVKDEHGEQVVRGLCSQASEDSGLVDCIREISGASKISEDLYQRTCWAALETFTLIAEGAAQEGYPVSEYSPFQFEPEVRIEGRYRSWEVTDDPLLNRFILVKKVGAVEGTPCDSLAMDMAGDDSKWVEWGK